jgi:hypothetical protein
VFVTFAIGTFGLAGRSTNAELRNKYQTIISPNGWSFSIWGPIFILQAFWVLWQILVPSQRNSEGVTQVGWLYALAVVFQCGWTLSFRWEIIWLSLLCMMGICASLVWVVLRLQKYEKIWKGYFLWQFPMSLHCGWIIAASAVNTNVVTVFYDASATIQIAVAGASLGVLILVGFAWLAAFPVDLTPPLVLIWAFVGVYLALNDPTDAIMATFTERQITSTKYSVLGGIGLIGAGVLLKGIYVLAVQRPAAMKAKQQEVRNDSTTDVLDEENPKITVGDV